MHLVQAFTRWPANFLRAGFVISLGITTHWRLGYFLLLTVGLYFPLNFTLFQTIMDPFLHIVHSLAIVFIILFIIIS